MADRGYMTIPMMPIAEVAKALGMRPGGSPIAAVRLAVEAEFTKVAGRPPPHTVVAVATSAAGMLSIGGACLDKRPRRA